MAHQQMFDETDPVLARVRRAALALPEAAEKVSHGRPAFYTVKVFAYYGGSQRISGEWLQHPHAIVMQPDPDDAPALRQDARYWTPAYLGSSGWLGLDLDDDSDWDEVAEILESSYRFTAPKRLVRRLD